MEFYTEPALFGSLQMRQVAANALRNAYFQRDMVNCGAVIPRRSHADPWSADGGSDDLDRGLVKADSRRKPRPGRSSIVMLGWASAYIRRPWDTGMTPDGPTCRTRIPGWMRLLRAPALLSVLLPQMTWASEPSLAQARGRLSQERDVRRGT